jgi:peroxiredoxin
VKTNSIFIFLQFYNIFNIISRLKKNDYNWSKFYEMKRIIFSVLLFAVMVTGIMAQDDATINKTGDKAPAFVCTTIDGRTIDISKLNGKIIMINFFATWCGPCNSELPVLQKEVWEKYKNNPDFVLIVIGREHSEKDLKEFAANKGLNLPFAPDPKREIYSLYAKQSIPRNVIIGRDGKILFQNIGYSSEEFKNVTSLLAKELNK